MGAYWVVAYLLFWMMAGIGGFAGYLSTLDFIR